MAYPFTEIENRWQGYWATNKTFKTDTSDDSKPKCFILDMFPYPSGDGLHVGHPEGYTATDILARYKRHRGFNVLHPMGWDAFGLPAEQYAMKTNVHPRVTTERNVAYFRKQLQSFGFSYDWDRELNTTDPAYYRWTQWIFITVYNTWFDARQAKGRAIDELISIFKTDGSNGVDKPKNYDGTWDFSAQDFNAMTPLQQQEVVAQFRLAYQAFIPVNWCEALGTVLANEEVDEWTSKGYVIERRPMQQWMMRITAYADRLLQSLDGLKWPASTLEMQRNWIGKSEGAEIVFATESGDEIRVFTTRPDTLFGATFVTIAPEHALVDKLVTPEQRDAVDAYRKVASTKSERERQSSDEKTGVWTGAYAINPADNARIPIWTSDYVLAGYGTGAVMAVPAHDERDFIFATKFGLPITTVIEPPIHFSDRDAVLRAEVCYTGAGTMMNSGSFNGISNEDAKQKIVASLGDNGRTTIQYKLRDWLFSRQRYWGEPIPIVHYPNGIVEPLSNDELPLLLPEISEFKPSGTRESPLALATDWLRVEHPEHGVGRRETNTMPQWAGSCWYYLRYLDPNNADAFVDKNLESKWMPVDLYVGGAEHAVLHLLYTRFWHKVLFDRGYVSTDEPLPTLVHQGMILGEDQQKMSKSRGNVVNPDDVIAEHGADALRLFEMFMGPLEMSKPWSTTGVEGVNRFLNRAWRMVIGDEERGTLSIVSDREPTVDEQKVIHGTIRKVTEDIEGIRLNTAISALMVFVNAFLNASEKPRSAMEIFLKLLSPFAPHVAEEMWSRLGHTTTIAYEPWPAYDSSLIESDEVEIVLQVSSKVKGKMLVAVGTDIAELETAALAHEAIQNLIAGKNVKRVVAVKDKLVNVILG